MYSNLFLIFYFHVNDVNRRLQLKLSTAISIISSYMYVTIYERLFLLDIQSLRSDSKLKMPKNQCRGLVCVQDTPFHAQFSQMPLL